MTTFKDIQKQAITNIRRALNEDLMHVTIKVRAGKGSERNVAVTVGGLDEVGVLDVRGVVKRIVRHCGFRPVMRAGSQAERNGVKTALIVLEA